MTTAELAKDFTSILKNNDHEKAAAKYNADNIVSYEAMQSNEPAAAAQAATSPIFDD